MDNHYVCSDCKGVSDHAKVCETPNCSKEGHDLGECRCDDGSHNAPGETPEKEKGE